ncbi:uncharacterized protein BJ171DRAFT_256061 [Polychytrium aggregatum]|uniref:uncharacterized protein n=1 Tax=Polychytrium aggregatum TaxID=110093 RepID=UPI0022FF4094|nr:uncharacterized protein BJ171DRAFT_256061 [Polychytrium aggregatum]KAI9207837.1 hypothetical protein BJ171DRAFT_256061 [Polychytrium aggregatum]
MTMEHPRNPSSFHSGMPIFHKRPWSDSESSLDESLRPLDVPWDRPTLGMLPGPAQPSKRLKQESNPLIHGDHIVQVTAPTVSISDHKRSFQDMAEDWPDASVPLKRPRFGADLGPSTWPAIAANVAPERPIEPPAVDCTSTPLSSSTALIRYTPACNSLDRCEPPGPSVDTFGLMDLIQGHRLPLDIRDCSPSEPLMSHIDALVAQGIYDSRLPHKDVIGSDLASTESNSLVLYSGGHHSRLRQIHSVVSPTGLTEPAAPLIQEIASDDDSDMGSPAPTPAPTLDSSSASDMDLD